MSNIESTPKKPVGAPFMVGVTGYMDLLPEEVEPLTERLQRLFDFLRNGAEGESFDKLLIDLVPDRKDAKLQEKYRAALNGWTGLSEETPIVVLTNLAPGVDTLVAKLVLAQCAKDNFWLLCPLPFPPHIYCTASTFVRVKDGLPDPDNQKRQQELLELLVDMELIDRDLVELATGTAELPDKLVDALRRLPKEKFFAVRLTEDVKCSEDRKCKEDTECKEGLKSEEKVKCDAEAQQAKWLTDRDNSDRRHLRYYAAGEYLTVTAHLLIAVWNGQRETSSSGTSAVVEARLYGPRQGLLSTTSDVPLHHGGPVFHLLANRPNGPAVDLECCAETQNDGRPLPPLRILHPFTVAGRDCPTAAVIGARQAKNIELQSDRLRLLARIGENLSNFNSPRIKLSERKDRDREYQKLLEEPTKIEPNLQSLLECNSVQFAEGLRYISDVRCRSSELTAYYQKQVNRTLVRLFWLTLLAAIALHFCSHWHPRHSHKDGGTSKLESENSQGEHLNSVQVVCGWISLLLAAGAVIYFGWQRSKKLEAQDHDTRAISEGLRVQFFWNLAGLGKSVSANYMSRHRSELDWIRGVIRATAIPYERWREQFSKLDVELQLRALRVVQKGWVRNQLSYFRKKSHEKHHADKLWREFGSVAALAGVLTLLKLISHESGYVVAGFFDFVCHAWLAVLMLAIAGGWSWYIASRRAIGSSASGRNGFTAIFPGLYDKLDTTMRSSREAFRQTSVSSRAGHLLGAAAWFLVWLYACPGIVLEFVSVLVPTHPDSALTHTTLFRRLNYGVRNFVAHLPLALVIACAGIGLCHWIAAIFPTFPHALHLTYLSGGALLVVGALSVAWAEKNLFSEWAYQYSTMTGLFEAADALLEKELAEFNRAIKEKDSCAKSKSLQRIQALLFELGQEALDENAEWLILHRARPLEPVFAG